MNEHLKTLIANNDLDGVNKFLNSNEWRENPKHHSNWDDYNTLKDLISKGQTEMVKLCITKGFRTDRRYNGCQEDDSPFHLAVIYNQPEIVELMVAKNVFSDIRNHDNKTPLILAAERENWNIVDIILKEIQSDNFANEDYFSHFHIACMRKNIRVIKEYLQNKADINAIVRQNAFNWPGYTPLHFAVHFHNVDTVKFLLENGADITIKNKKGLTPLHLAFKTYDFEITDTILSAHSYYHENTIGHGNLSHFHIACARNKIDVVRDFVYRKLKIDHIVSKTSKYWAGYNCLKFSIENHSLDVFNFLLKYKIDTSDYPYSLDFVKFVLMKGNSAMIDIMVRNEIFYKQRYHVIHEVTLSTFQYTNLHLAVLNKTEITPILQYQYLDIVTKDSQGKTPLHIAFETKQTDTVDKMLLVHHKIKDNPVDKNGLSHFHIACTRKNIKVVETFLYNGVDLNSSVNIDSTYWPGFTPLHFAIDSECKELIMFLLDNKSDVTKKNGLGISPYELALSILSPFSDKHQQAATRSLYVKVIENILNSDYYEKLEEFDNRGMTLLHVACVKDDLEMVKKFINSETINKTVDVDIEWKNVSPLHLATYFKNERLVPILLDNGADASKTDSVGNVPAHFLGSVKGIEDYRLFLTESNFVITFFIENSEYSEHSVFHLACQLDDIRAVQHHLNLGVDVNEPIAIDSDSMKAGMTPLHIAVSTDSREVVEVLLNHNANVHAVDAKRQTPLHICSDFIILKKLIDHGADIHALDWNLDNPIMVYTKILRHIYPRIIMYHLAEGADVNHESRNGSILFQNLTRGRNTRTTETDIQNLTILMKHIKKLEILGLPVSLKNQEYYDEWLPTLQRRNSFNESEYIQECLDELERMKNTVINRNTTLLNLILKNTQEIIRLVYNEKLKELIESDDFKVKFSIYGYLIKLQLKRGLVRLQLLEQSAISLKFLTNQPMGTLIFEKILGYLTNDEMKSLIEATPELNN